VSAGGGISPVRRADGRELFYLRTSGLSGLSTIQMIAVQVDTQRTFQFGVPTSLFEGRYDVNHPARTYDVTADGQRFVMLRSAERPADSITEINVVLNWQEELKQRVPTR
jgi:hypothetical protein